MQTQEFRSPRTWEGVGPSTGGVYSASWAQRPQRPALLTGPASVTPACTPIAFALLPPPGARPTWRPRLPLCGARSLARAGPAASTGARCQEGQLRALPATGPAQGRTASRPRWCQRAGGDGEAGRGRSGPTAAQTSRRTSPGMARTRGAQAAAPTFPAGRKGSLPLPCP